MKYENLEQVKNICEIIKSHRTQVELLKDSPLVVIYNGGYAGTSNAVEKITASSIRGPELWAKTLVDTLIKDYESRIYLLERQLKTL